MMLFWPIAAAMTVVALTCVVKPLLDARGVLDARHGALAGLVTALVPLAALALYMRIGDPGALAIGTTASSSAEHHADTPDSMNAAVTRLVARLRREPNDAPGWAMLARSYAAPERPADAVAAYRHALALNPRDPDLLADFADALASANGSDLSGEPSRNIEAALAIAPDHPKVLALAASAALDRRDFALTTRYWQRLSEVPGIDPGIAQQARRNIDETRASSSAGAKRTVVANVSLDPAFDARVHASDAVFVYALGDDGGRMPLAVKRLRADQLPARVKLDDSMSMTPERSLSNVERFRIVARVSATGTAQPSSGDLSGTSGIIARDGSSVDVVIREIVR